MKKHTVTIVLIAIVIFACKKKTDQWCQYQAMKGNNPIYAWDVYKPSNEQIQKVQDTCRCTVTIKEICQPCSGVVTDAAGNDIACF
jgi:hypothetical protein